MIQRAFSIVCLEDIFIPKFNQDITDDLVHGVKIIDNEDLHNRYGPFFWMFTFKGVCSSPCRCLRFG